MVDEKGSGSATPPGAAIPSVAAPAAAPSSSPVDHFVRAWVDAVTVLMKDHLGIEAKSGMRCHRRMDKLPGSEVTIFSSVSGAGAKGMVALSFGKETFKNIFAKLTNKSDSASGPPDELAKFVSDAQNAAIAALNPKGLVLETGLSAFVSGGGMNPVFLTNAPVIAVPFETPYGVFHLEFAFAVPLSCKILVPSDIRILVADDSRLVRKGVVRFLNGLGLTNIIEAVNGEDAWKGIQGALAMNKPFDLVLADWNMPVQTGIELLKNVRANEKTKALRFIIFTGEQDVDHVRAAVQAGVSGYIVKPVVQEVLGKKIEALWSSTKK
ncbi:MAG TPA: hypothetical protein DIS93_06685 [Bdellovibrionales bacterium]|nr:hypothetical protein [Bdellovibrionales bacterium]